MVTWRSRYHPAVKPCPGAPEQLGKVLHFSRWGKQHLTDAFFWACMRDYRTCFSRLVFLTSMLMSVDSTAVCSARRTSVNCETIQILFSSSQSLPNLEEALSNAPLTCSLWSTSCQQQLCMCACTCDCYFREIGDWSWGLETGFLFVTGYAGFVTAWPVTVSVTADGDVTGYRVEHIYHECYQHLAKTFTPSHNSSWVLVRLPRVSQSHYQHSCCLGYLWDW